MPAPDQPKCPSCGGHDLRPRGKRYALYPYGLVSFLGLLVAIFHQASLPLEYTCRQCGTEIRERSAGAGCAYAIFIVGLAGTLAFHAIFYLYLIFFLAGSQRVAG